MTRLRSFLWAGFLAFVVFTQAYCLPEPDPREKIEELRVLGIKANPPAAKPGDSVQLSALVAIHTADKIELEWFLCRNPADVEHGCHEKSDAIKLGKADTVTATIPTDALQAELTPAEKLNGRAIAITLLARAGKETVVATKRVIVSNNPNNQNPTLSDLTLYGEDGTTPLPTPWTLQPEKKYKLTAKVDDNSRETYQRVDPAGNQSTVKERLYLSWYLTAGSYTKGYLSGTPDDLTNTLITPKELPPSGQITLYLILRDGRGGVDWKTYTAQVK